MRIKHFFLTLLIFIISNCYSLDNYLIKDIYFKGLQRITIKTAKLNLPIKIGDKINSNDISNTIKSLFSLNYFEDIKIKLNENILIIQLKEKPTITKIIISGNKSIKNNLLQQNLKNLNIQIGELLDQNNVNIFEKQIQQFFHNIGKFNARIKIFIKSLSRNRVKLHILFSEGNPIKIQQINFIGNKIFTTKQLLQFFELNDNSSWWNFILNQQYKKEIFINDLEMLRNFYLDHGYAKFNINSTKISLTPNKKNMYITIYINEGDKYTISETQLNSKPNEYYNKINKLIIIKPNSIFNGTKINNIHDKIKNLLGNFGYAYPNIKIETIFDDINKKIKLKFNVDIGKRFYVRQINFIGNFNTKDSILRHEMHQMEGAWLANNLIELGMKKLNRTGFFDNIDIEIKQVPNIPDQVDVLYKVIERNTGSMQLGFGLGNKGHIGFHGGFQQENLFGTGNSIGINAHKNIYSTYAELSFINPYFTIDNINFAEKIFYNNFSAKNADLAHYDNTTYGMENIFSIPFDENNTLKFGLGFVYNYLSDMKPQVSIWRYLYSIGKQINLNKKINYTINDVTMHFGWNHNTLDRKLFPNIGNNTSIDSKITIPLFKNQYYKIEFNTLQYYPISEDQNWIILSKLNLGYGTGFGHKELPFYENFHTHGSSMVRGFLSNNIGPKAIYLDTNKDKYMQIKNNSPSTDAIGGNAMITASLELIIPLPFINEQYMNSIRTSVFIDTGTIWDTNWNKTPTNWKKGIPDYGKLSNIRLSAGISLQWMSPIGLLVFSYAKPIKQYTGDKTESFQFNIGKMW